MILIKFLISIQSHKFPVIAHPNYEVIANEELPIGFTMSLAQHSDILSRFASLSKQEQERIVDGARQVKSREEMNSYVENMFQG